MKGSVTTERGLDPHLTSCPVCTGDAEELTIGEVVKYFGKESDQLLGYGHPGGVLAELLIQKEVPYRVEPVSGAERVPASGPCPDCAADILHQNLEFEDVVKGGGIHWRCEACHSYGVIVEGDSRGFSAAVRRGAGVLPPNQIRVTFTNCIQHESEGDHLTGLLH